MALESAQGTDAKFQVNEPVLAGDVLYTATGNAETASPRRVQAYDAKNKLLWEIDADGTGDLIQAGNRLYAAGGGRSRRSICPTSEGRRASPGRSQSTGDVCRLVAAADRLFAVTLDGQILAFGAEANPITIETSAPFVPDG
jgi:hypothetical protein